MAFDLLYCFETFSRKAERTKAMQKNDSFLPIFRMIPIHELLLKIKKKECFFSPHASLPKKRWSLANQIHFLQTFDAGAPFPVVTFLQSEQNWVLLDGNQRVQAFQEFFFHQEWWKKIQSQPSFLQEEIELLFQKRDTIQKHELPCYFVEKSEKMTFSDYLFQFQRKEEGLEYNEIRFLQKNNSLLSEALQIIGIVENEESIPSHSFQQETQRFLPHLLHEKNEWLDWWKGEKNRFSRSSEMFLIYLFMLKSNEFLQAIGRNVRVLFLI